MSNRQRTYRTRAVILRRRDYRDADRILKIFTPRLGNIEVIAKGIRKTKNTKAGHLELFTHTSLLIANARTWDVVSEAVTVESFKYLRQDLDAIGYASYVSELIDKFSEAEDENEPMWDLFLHALRMLDVGVQIPSQSNPQVLLRWFELHLLSISGFQPQFFYCLRCGNEIQPVSNFLSMLEGGIFCADCGQGHEHVELIRPEILRVLRFLQRSGWQEVEALQVRPDIMRRVENILYRYILTILERRLRSTEFLRKLAAQRGQ
ncbi:MAG: DNA repair protein RecO [Chloroflexota bacterium]